MRPIKFRAWDRKSKKMRTVDDLKNLWTLCNHGGEVKTIPNVIVINQSYKGDDLELVVDKDCDLMQYTGLKDKTGKEIYAGDLLKDEQGNIGKVFWQNSQAHFAINWQRKDGSYDTDCCFGYGEVIGNIYENPELLNRKRRKKIL